MRPQFQGTRVSVDQFRNLEPNSWLFPPSFTAPGAFDAGDAVKFRVSNHFVDLHYCYPASAALLFADEIVGVCSVEMQDFAKI